MGAGNPPSPRAQQFSAYFSAEPQDTSADTIRSSLSSCADSGRVLDNPFLGGTDEHMALQLRMAGFTPEVGSNVLPITVGFQLQLWGSIILIAAACRFSIGSWTTIHRNCAIYLSESLSRFVFGENLIQIMTSVTCLGRSSKLTLT